MALVSSETTAGIGATESARMGGMPTLLASMAPIQGNLDDRLARLGKWGAVHRIADRASEASASEASREGAPGWLVGWGERGSLS